MADGAAHAGWRADISLLRLTATVAVVADHVFGTVLNHEQIGATGAKLLFYNAVANCVNWHVPVFFMITGILMLDRSRQITPTVSVRRYALRIVLALLVFGVPFSLIKLVFNTGTFTASMLPQALADMLRGETFDHLWYLYTLVGLYLFMPLFKCFTDRVSERVFRYVLLALFVYDFCLPFVGSLLDISIAFHAPVSYPVFYLLAGAYLANWTPAPLRSRRLCAGGVLLLLAVAVAGHYLPERISLCTYTSPVTALSSCCAFCLFRGLDVPEKWRRTLWRLDRLCFGAYLVHPVFIHAVYSGLHILPSDFRLYPLATVLFFVGFTVVSFLASWVMNLIPPLKKYIL